MTSHGPDPAHGTVVGGMGGAAERRPVPWDDPEPLSGPIGVPLVDLLDRVLSTGVVVSGDLVIAIADVPLVRLSLHALLSSVSARMPAPWRDGGPL